MAAARRWRHAEAFGRRFAAPGKRSWLLTIPPELELRRVSGSAEKPALEHDLGAIAQLQRHSHAMKSYLSLCKGLLIRAA